MLAGAKVVLALASSDNVAPLAMVKAELARALAFWSWSVPAERVVAPV